MRLTKTKSIGSDQDPESQAGRQSAGYGCRPIGYTTILYM